MSVTVKQLSKHYGEQKAVDRVSFDIPQGQVVGFLGPNGAGKSTTMKILTGFIPQSEGEASVCGYDVSTHSMDARRCIGYLPENNPLYPSMYIREYLLFVAGLYKLDRKKERVDNMIGLTGLSEERNKKIGQLSKGYRQRVGLAQAMIHDPRVLILDEPTSGLDPNQLGEIRRLIATMGQEKTVILSTHIMQEVQAICQRVIIINKGRIVADDQTAKLQQMSKAGQWVHVAFKEEVNPSLLEQLKDVSHVESLGQHAWRLHCHPGRDVREAVFHLSRENDLTIVNLQLEEKSLEDVFQELTLGDPNSN